MTSNHPHGEVAEQLVIEALRKGHPIEWMPTGGSMWPWIRSGSRVTARPVGWRQVAALPLGAVVLRYGDHIEYLHRVVGRDDAGRPMTRGDTLECPDPPVEQETMFALIERVCVCRGITYNPNRLLLRRLGLVSGRYLPGVRRIMGLLLSR